MLERKGSGVVCLEVELRDESGEGQGVSCVGLNWYVECLKLNGDRGERVRPSR
jgi:hypothetical protein